MYVSDRTLQVVDNGIVANFLSGVPRPLRPSLVHKALAMGVREVADGEQVSQPELAVEEPDADELTAGPDDNATVDEIIEAVLAAMAEGNQDLFTRNGALSARAIEPLIGKNTTLEARTEALLHIPRG